MLFLKEFPECNFAFFIPKLPAFKRIGPHKEEIYSFLTGSILGDGYGEKHGLGVRFHFHYSHRNIEYLIALHKKLYSNGYCDVKKPSIKKIVGKQGKIYFSCRFRTFTFTSFLSLYDEWYSSMGRKKVPENIEKYLTPLALSVWIINDGSFTGFGIKIATDNFQKQEVEFLISVLKTKFGLEANLQKYKDNWRIYIPKSSMPKLVKLIQPFVVPSMQYKLGSFLKNHQKF